MLLAKTSGATNYVDTGVCEINIPPEKNTLGTNKLPEHQIRGWRAGLHVEGSHERSVILRDNGILMLHPICEESGYLGARAEPMRVLKGWICPGQGGVPEFFELGILTCLPVSGPHMRRLTKELERALFESGRCNRPPDPENAR